MILKLLFGLITSVNLLISCYLFYNYSSFKEQQSLLTKIAVVNSACNRYEIRGLQHYGKYPGSYPDVVSVIFPNICIYQDLLVQLYSIKYKNYKPSRLEIGGFDTYFTGRDNKEIDKQIEKQIEITEKEIKDLIKK